MPISAIVLLVSDALTASGAVVNCYALHKCGRSLPDATSILSRVNVNLPGYARRQDVGVCGVPQYNFNTCQNDLRGVMVQSSLPAAGEARFENIPASCMDLATVLTGACGAEAPTVTVCGSACLSYTGLTSDQLDQLSQTLAPYAA
ncbi:hypothetical protein F4801DRAFT_573377 [Xylaria longipes]|nr:hypothetical protein F4801DRAFT_573377 [Xylaria longipes]